MSTDQIAPPRLAFAMRPDLKPQLFDTTAIARIGELANAEEEVITTFTAAPPTRLVTLEVLITGWGCPPIGAPELDRMPQLKAVLHTGGSVKGQLAPQVWERGVIVSSAADANARPVAEYTLAMILLAGKGVFGLHHRYANTDGGLDVLAEAAGLGNYGRRVGIIGASRIGRRVIELLRPFDLRVQVYDPYLDPADLDTLAIPAVGLDELLAGSEVLSVHAPATPTTVRMLDRRRLALLPTGATLINTARGSLIDQPALVEELASGRLNAILDVTDPDALPAGHPLRSLPNVILTPHIAGALGNELHRLGASAVQALTGLVHGTAIPHLVSLQDRDRSA